MESALDVLSRAATMVQDNANEARLAAKDLPTKKWRRERRARAGEYLHHPSSSSTSTQAAATATASSSGSPDSPPQPTVHSHSSPYSAAHAALVGGSGGASNSAMMSTAIAPAQMHMMMVAAAAGMRPLHESADGSDSPPPEPLSLSATNLLHLSHASHTLESPIDMSVTSNTMKPRSSPPPPYREPLPGSTYAASLARPSVITQAPPKREGRDSSLVSSRDSDNRSSDSISMCDTVIDEHFRRSLGPEYMTLFSKKSPTQNSTPSPQPSSNASTTATGAPAPVQAVSAGGGLPLQTSPLSFHVLPNPKALISPKPTSTLLSSSAVSMVAHMQSEHGSPILEKQPIVAYSPPQHQPLSLHRSSSPHRGSGGSSSSKSNSPQPQALNQRSGAQKNSPPVAVRQFQAHAHLRGGDLHGGAHSPGSPHSPCRLSSPDAASHQHTVVATSSTATVPAIVRIKTEPGLLTTTTTPPASPTSAANATINSKSDVIASVDDHFAKALGDTWTKLQKSKEIRK